MDLVKPAAYWGTTRSDPAHLTYTVSQQVLHTRLTARGPKLSKRSVSFTKVFEDVPCLVKQLVGVADAFFRLLSSVFHLPSFVSRFSFFAFRILRESVGMTPPLPFFPFSVSGRRINI